VDANDSVDSEASARVLGEISRQFGVPPKRLSRKKREIAQRVKAQMDEEKKNDPDPLGATPVERLAVDPDCRAHTPEGRKKARQSAQWRGKMRRLRAEIVAQVRAEIACRESRRRVVPVPSTRPIVRARGRRSRRPTRGSPAAALPRRSDDEPEPPDLAAVLLRRAWSVEEFRGALHGPIGAALSTRQEERPTPELSGKAKVDADAVLRRVYKGLGGINGYVDGLVEAGRFDRVHKVATAEDVAALDGLIGDAIHGLRQIRRALAEEAE
jgi:hypothetical protein